MKNSNHEFDTSFSSTLIYDLLDGIDSPYYSDPYSWPERRVGSQNSWSGKDCKDTQ